MRGLAAAALLSLVSACGGGNGAALQRIEVTPALASVPAGASQQYVATAVYRDDRREDVTQTASWASSGPAIATVGDVAPGKGRVQTLAAGSATLSAQIDGNSGSALLTVREAAPTTLAITPATSSIAKGTSQRFVATATFSDGSVHDISADAVWTSSNAAVATVGDTGASKGLAAAVDVGSAQIRGVYEGIAGSATLTVTAATVASVAVTPSVASRPKGTSLPLVATATLSDGSTQNVTSQAVWASSAPAVAAVSDAAETKGLAQTLAVGTARLSAAFAGSSGSADLTVTAAELLSIAVAPPSPSLPLGLALPFTATGLYTDSSTADLTTQVTWSSSDSGVATVSNAAGSNGLAQSAAVGSSTITATQPGSTISGSAALTVTAVALARVEITPTAPSLPVGATQPFTATGYYTDNSFQDLTPSATWSVADTAVADIGNDSGSRGLALAKGIGSTQVHAEVDGQSAETTLTVTAATLSAIQVTPASRLLAAGYTRQFTATGLYSDNSTRDLTDVANWTTTTAAFATVSNAGGSKGLVTGISAGTVNVAAAIGEVSGLTPLTVTDARVTSVAVTPANPTIPLGTTQQFVATATFSDGSTQDLSTQSSWGSTQPTIASISNRPGSQGKATAESIGRTEISAEAGGWIGRSWLNVSAATLGKITISPNPAALAKGNTLALTATGTYSDNSAQDISGGDVTWSSSDTSVATVSNGSGASGAVKGVKEGSVTINAVLGSITGTGALNVGSAVLALIAVTPADRSVAKGVPVQYTASSTYSDGSVADLTASVTWASDAPAVATVSSAAGSGSGAAARSDSTTLRRR